MLVKILLFLFGSVRIRRHATRHWHEIIGHALADRSDIGGKPVSEDLIREIADQAYFRAARMRSDRMVRIGDYHETLLSLLTEMGLNR